MSCLGCEQLRKEISKGLNKVVNITEAWINVISNDPKVETLAKIREATCYTCKSRIEIMKINGNSIYKCAECNCPLIALVRSNEKCKLNKW